jgi:hypothetical protein
MFGILSHFVNTAKNFTCGNCACTPLSIGAYFCEIGHSAAMKIKTKGLVSLLDCMFLRMLVFLPSLVTSVFEDRKVLYPQDDRKKMSSIRILDMTLLIFLIKRILKLRATNQTNLTNLTNQGVD